MTDRLTTLNLPAPAKLNLFLHITGRRDDGYHELQTVFQLLDYSDQIRLVFRTDSKITRAEDSDAHLNNIPFESDLCVRAAKLMQSQLCDNTSNNPGVEIHLQKKLPIGGGIGGGSSDAATVLCGLNKLWQCDFSIDELAELGAKIGADVPVFVRGESAWAEGIGEQLTQLSLDPKWFVVIHPKLFVSTAEIFTDQGLTRDCDTLKIARFLKGNRFDFLMVIKKHPEIANVIEWLSSYSPARLTGTGSCVFAAFNSEDDATEVVGLLTKSNHNWSAFVAKGVNQSPLITALQK
ncbi:UNVERIFIED_CONTAM: hypothetical protein GTU68_038222 [Idotea baltica]|nr:hypothetical protein [Idotea baltica]